MSKLGDLRVCEIVKPGLEGADVVLLGYPLDEGVRRNGGRMGNHAACVIMNSRPVHGMNTVTNTYIHIHLQFSLQR